MPVVSIAARLLRSDFTIQAHQWFAVYENDTIELISDSLAAALLKHKPPPALRAKPTFLRSKPDEITKLTHALQQKLEVLAAHKKPIVAGKHNNSGQFSKLKALGYASNEDGKWAITDVGRIAVQLANGHAEQPSASDGDATSHD